MIARLARRDLEARYRGSLLGLVWTVLTPLLMMAVYTFVFSVVFRARWGVADGGTAEFGLLLFSGLILFNIFAECVTRAPGLMMENISYIKKVVFPLEILPAVVLTVALFNATVSTLVLYLFYFAVLGLPPLTAVLAPLVLIPLSMLTLGLTWFLASAGVFLRDLRQVVAVLVTVVMFLSPIFYPVTALPESYRVLIYFNPLTLLMEELREALFWGHALPWLEWAVYTLAAWAWMWLGYMWFVKTRKAFADVV